MLAHQRQRLGDDLGVAVRLARIGVRRRQFRGAGETRFQTVVDEIDVAVVVVRIRHGWNPWRVQRPFLLDVERARRLDLRPELDEGRPSGRAQRRLVRDDLLERSVELNPATTNVNSDPRVLEFDLVTGYKRRGNSARAQNLDGGARR